MKDLKHALYYEKLLQQADNELVEKSIEDGNIALGYSCYFIPEVLLNLPGCFSTRLRAPETGNIDLGTYYMSSKICSYTRSILERGIEGGYDYLSALFSAETCQMMHRGHEHFEILGLVKKRNPDFFMSMMDVPFITGDAELEHYSSQLQHFILDKLSEVYGINVSDSALLKAIDAHNELCDVVSAIGEYRKAENPVITGYEFSLVQLASLTCPHDLILPYLKETLSDLQSREPDEKSAFRARVVLTGSEIDDPQFIKVIEGSGALVVADRYCFGALPGREKIVVKDGETPLDAIARHYLETSQCPRFMNKEKGQERLDYIENLVREYNADGIICEQMKFCEYWSYERVISNVVFNNEKNIPCLGIEKEYTLTSAGQLRTRVQAFIESLEIKKLQRGTK